VRSFVAVWPPEPVLDRLAAIERPVAADGLRWTSRGQWHVTLRFLGEVGVADVPAAVEVVGEVASTLAPVTVSLADRVSRFGRDVLHVEVSGLAPWAAAVATGFERAGIGAPSEGRPFVGHVTLARSRRRERAAADMVERLAGDPLPSGPSSWTAHEIALVRSELGRGPARYTNVAVMTVR
jgi:2'-5' RNA ligase